MQIGAPAMGRALDADLARQFGLHLMDWLKLPLTEITKAMVVVLSP